jgi:hypothetical protein
MMMSGRGQGTVGRCAAAFALLLGARAIVAQEPTVEPLARRWSIRTTFDAGTIPDEFSTRCGQGRGGTLGAGLGFAVVHRSQSGLVLESDTHAMLGVLPTGCKLSLPVTQISPGVYETRPGYNFPGSSDQPLTRSAVRVGFETPRNRPYGRASIGGGLIWSGSTLPFGTAAVGVGTRGAGTRFYAEFEMNVARVRGVETRSRFSDTVSLGSSQVAKVFYPHWGGLNLGFEIPVGGR